MSVENIDFKAVSEKLMLEYSRGYFKRSEKLVQSRRLERKVKSLTGGNRSFVLQIMSLSNILDRYNDPVAQDKALEKIDLGSIYEGVDRREKEGKGEWKYEDFIVMELLRYFKNDFFKWITKPRCVSCGNDSDNIVSLGASGPPEPNPHEISRIENYMCNVCSLPVSFPRYNSPVKLLETREGRCGEWVNCFLLILKAMLGPNSKVRYIWNYEDHVWCEYYSETVKRWIHLDPCEGVFDAPFLYCDNWGKKMSFVYGTGDEYMIDLSKKYIKPEKQIDQKSIVSNTNLVAFVVKCINAVKFMNYYGNLSAVPSMTETDKLMRIYEDIIVLQNRESMSVIVNTSNKVSSSLPQGRQTGDEEWTTARGESG